MNAIKSVDQPTLRLLHDQPVEGKLAIQPFGCLLVLDQLTLRVQACSANCAELLGMEAEQLLGHGLAEVFPAAAELVACFQQPEGPLGRPPLPRLPAPDGGLMLELRGLRRRDDILLEVEPVAELAMDLRLQRLDLAAVNRRLAGHDRLERVCDEAARMLQQLSGYRDVSLICFEPGGRLVPVANIGEPPPDFSTESRTQIRRLARGAPLSYAPRADSRTVPMIGGNLPSDINVAQLCRVSSALFADTGGWMCLALPGADGDAPWGCVLCRDPRPHPVTARMRGELMVLVGLVSAQIARLAERGLRVAAERGAERAFRLLSEIDLGKPFPASLAGKEPLLCELLGADGVEYIQDGERLLGTSSCDLSPAQMRKLLAWIKAEPGPIWYTDDLGEQLGDVGSIGPLLGLCADEDRQDVLLFGRRGDAAAWAAEDLAAARALHRLIHGVIIANAANFEQMSRSLAQQTDRLKRTRREVEYLAHHDALTGLPNRKNFRESLNAAVANAEVAGGTYAVGLLDVDHFQAVNDTLGHDKGDVLLCAVAERIMDMLLPRDLVARLGGDEFALLLHNDGGEHCCDTAEKIVAALREAMDDQEDRFVITGSLGVAVGHAGSDPSELMRQADRALAQAKRTGRDRVVQFQEEVPEGGGPTVDVERAVRLGSPKQAIEIQMQPLVPITSISGQRRFEILARWRTDDGALILPTEFLPAAERSGKMRELTRVVSQRAIEVLRGRPEDEKCLRLGINIGAADLEARWFARGLLDELRTAGVPAGCIEIEISEDLLHRANDTTTESLRVLARGGLHFAVDDFGTGFSSIGQLQELPIDVLKIDRRFIQGLTDQGGPDRDLVAGVIALAHSLDKITVAEGVETEQQLRVLESLGCDWGQGYLWSRPLPPHQALALKFEV